MIPYLLALLILVVLIFVFLQFKPHLPTPNTVFTISRNFISRLLERLASVIQLAARKIFVYREKSIDFFFGDLTPTNEADPDRLYDKRIEWAIHNPNVKNLALTGAYSSGKSSILKTFEKRHPEFNYLKISLASFKDPLSGDPAAGAPKPPADKNDAGKTTKVTTIEDLVELSILQQIFYYVRHRDIPGSRFKRIQKRSRLNLSTRTVGFMLFLFSAGLFWKPDSILKSLRLIDFSGKHSLFLFIMQLAFGIPGTFIVIYSILKTYGNSKFQKLNISSGEVEMAPDVDSSILNKHLDEILYFFEATHYNVVIFEDLDRFEQPDIFTKLREMNILVNNSLQIKRKILFIYALKDNIFRDGNRTKFFDLIIPVIPIINSVNSGDLLIREIKTRKLPVSVPDQFLRTVCLYIDDMRVLISVVNEFLLYRELFAKLSIRETSLFAIILYKNIDPAGFADLQHARGVVADFMKNKSNYAQAIAEQVRTKLPPIDEELRKLTASIPEDIRELRYIYIGVLAGSLPDAFNGKIILNGQHIGLDDLTTDANFTALHNSHSIQYLGKVNHGNVQVMNANLPFHSIQNKVNPIVPYQDRENLLKQTKEGRIQALKQEKEKIAAELSIIPSLSIRQLFEKGAIPDLENKLGKGTLLSYLVRNGYLDEQYTYYTSYFYEGNLSKEDLDFLLSVKNEQALQFDAPLKQFENLINNMSKGEFERPTTLNIHLLEYLLSHADKEKAQLGWLMAQLANESPKSLEFVDFYQAHGQHVAIFFQLLAKSWPTLWEYVDNRSGYSNQKKDQYLSLMLQHIPVEQLVRLNGNDYLSTYLSAKEDFLAFSKDTAPQKVREIIKRLNPQFTFLQDDLDNRDLLKFIYEGDHYAINQEMITLISSTFGTGVNFNGHALTYSDILHSGCDKLIQYLDSHFDSFIKNVFLLQEQYRQEPEESLVIILGKDSIELAVKTQIMEGAAVQFSEIMSIHPDLWPPALANRKVKTFWRNVFAYYHGKGLDESLLAYLNDEKVYNPLTKEPIVLDPPAFNEAHTFLKALIENPGITDNALKAIAPPAKIGFDVDFSQLSPGRVSLLIKEGLAKLSSHNFQALKDQANNELGQLIMANLSEYLVSPGQYPLTVTQAIFLLNQPKISHENKQSLLNLVDLESITEENADNLLLTMTANNLRAPSQLAGFLMANSRHLPAKIKLITRGLLTVGTEEILALLIMMPPPYPSLANGAEVSLNHSTENKELMHSLVNWKLIGGFEEQDGQLVSKPAQTETPPSTE